MALNVYTDAQFVGNGGLQDNNAPPVAINDEHAQLAAAAQGWVSRMQAFAQTAPKEGLTRLLRVSTVIGGDRTVSVMNSARGLIGRAFPPAQNRVTYAACETLYHLCLHRVLLTGLDELVERKGLATPMQLDPMDRDGVVIEILDEKQAQAGLVQACAEAVAVSLADSKSDRFPAASERMGRFKQWAELVQGLAWIRMATRGDPLPGAFPDDSGAAPLPALPESMDNHFLLIQEKCIEDYCFHTPSSYFERVAALEAAAERLETSGASTSAAWRTPNGRIISYITNMANELAEHRAAALCYEICKASGGAAAEAVAEPLRNAASAMVAAVMSEHIDLIFNRNVTLVSMTAVMTAAKWAGLRLKISAVQRATDDLFGLNEKALTFPLGLPSSARQALKELERKKKGAAKSIDPDPASEGSGGGEENPKEGPPREFYNAVFLSIVELYRVDGEDDLEELFHDKGPALKAAVAEATSELNGGAMIVLEYPPGTGAGAGTTKSRKVKVEETPEPGLRKGGGGGGGGGGVAGSAGASNWAGGAGSGPNTSPRGRATATEPGVASARRPSAAKPKGKRALMAVSGGGTHTSKKKR